MTVPLPKTIVIGVGNPFRGDDGAGPAVAHLLRSQVPVGVSVLEESGEGTSLMGAWRTASRVILIDAVSSDGTPGTIHRMDASDVPVPSTLLPYSSHAFGLADAIEMARALHELPAQFLIYGIEASNFNETRVLSAEVHRAVSTVAAEILIALNHA
jgi:hydrogenase maturation protease